jgi:hypothetical protein
MPSWQTLKTVFDSHVIKSLFYSTFATSFAVLILRTALKDELGIDRTLTAIIVFFIATVFWSVGNVILSLGIPDTIGEFRNSGEYLEKEVKLYTQEQWSSELFKQKADGWEDDNYEHGKKCRSAIVVLIGISILFYVLGLFVFFLAASPLLRHFSLPV